MYIDKIVFWAKYQLSAHFMICDVHFFLYIILYYISYIFGPCRVGSVGSVSPSRTVGREFASWPGHTKDHHKNGTNYLPA